MNTHFGLVNHRKSIATIFFGLVSFIFAISPAQAVKNGSLDNQGHPFVGLMVAQDGYGNPMWRCSGTLISPTLFLTAGHCTSGASHVEIWFDADVESGIPANGYPFKGEVGGIPNTHPSYPTASFVNYDLGVVVLNTPVQKDRYGVLPGLDILDRLAKARGLQAVTFTAVGYGLQESFPDAASFQENNTKVRMVAYPRLIQINVPGFTGDYSMLLSNNHSTGGTCFGDSGGPNFIYGTDIVAGVTSFGINGNCAGTGGVYRVDRADDLNWLSTFQ